jgi:tetratricopeptide (TPR) repeat protein
VTFFVMSTLVYAASMPTQELTPATESSFMNELLVPELIDNMKMDNEQKFWFKSAMYHHLLGVQYFYEKEYGFAIKEFTKANNMSPNNPVVLMRLGTVYDKVGKSAQAKEFYNKAIALRPSLKTIKVL